MIWFAISGSCHDPPLPSPARPRFQCIESSPGGKGNPIAAGRGGCIPRRSVTPYVGCGLVMGMLTPRSALLHAGLHCLFSPLSWVPGCDGLRPGAGWSALAPAGAQRKPGSRRASRRKPPAGATEALHQHVFDIKRDAMRPQQRDKLLVKRSPAMVALLVLNVALHLGHLRFADRESPVAGLPGERSE